MKPNQNVSTDQRPDIDQDETEAALLLRQADTCFAAQDYAGAWQNLHRCTNLNGGSFEIFCAMAMCSMSMNDLDRARMEYLTAIRYNPDNPEARLNLAAVEKSLGMLNDAYHQVQIVLSLNPNDILARRLAGDINVQRGLFDLAAVEYQAVLRESPDDIQVLMGYGRTLFSLGKFQQAIDTYEKILSLDPGNEIAADNILIVRKKLGQASENLFHGDRGQVLKEARTAMKKGDHRRAKAILKPLVFSSEVTADICFVYGNICCLDNNYEEALVNYTKMVDLDPNDIRGHIRLSLTACMTGLTELARQHFSRARAIDPDHPDLLEVEVEILMLEKNFLPAAQLIYKAISTDMTRVDLLSRLGLCFENLGDPQLAADTYRKVLECEPEHAFASTSLKRIEHLLEENAESHHVAEDASSAARAQVA